jgi:hypothetical protein
LEGENGDDRFSFVFLFRLDGPSTGAGVDVVMST